MTHGNDVAEDGSYTLVCSSANVGAIKFAKTSISVKENAAYADVVVNRTAKEGAVRVRFGTVAGTAQPGSEYCPTNGILAWAANDNKAKTIRVKLIPDVTPTYEGDAKLFSVQLKALEEDELEDDEYPAQILTESAAVALTEVSKKTPGTISVTAYNGGDDDVAVTTPKKPTAVVTAGETLTLKLARSGGANGAVGVKVAVAKGTAVPDADFALASEDELVWADGDASEKTITIETYPAEVTGSYAESKTFTVKLAALAKAADGTAYDKPTLFQQGTVLLNGKPLNGKKTLKVIGDGTFGVEITLPEVPFERIAIQYQAEGLHIYFIEPTTDLTGTFITLKTHRFAQNSRAILTE